MKIKMRVANDSKGKSFNLKAAENLYNKIELLANSYKY